MLFINTNVGHTIKTKRSDIAKRVLLWLRKESPRADLRLPVYNSLFEESTLVDVSVTVEGENVEKIKRCEDILEKAKAGVYEVETCVLFTKQSLWDGDVYIRVGADHGRIYVQTQNVELLLPISPGTPFWVGEEIPYPGPWQGELNRVSASDMRDIIDPDAPTRLHGLWYTVLERDGGENMYVVADMTGDDTILKGPLSQEKFERWRKEMEDSKNEGGIENEAR